MALMELYSRRKRRRDDSGNVDIYKYDELPEKVRVQIIQIWEDVTNLRNSNDNARAYTKSLVEILRRELGVFGLVMHHENYSRRDEFVNWFLREQNIDYCFDAIELICRIFENAVQVDPWRFDANENDGKNGIEEINERLKEAGIGYIYEIEAHEIVRIDSQLVHAEVVKPALSLLTDPDFSAAQKEFLDAHGHYRQGDYEQALTECGKAFESTLKIIATKRGWTFDPKATAKPLLDLVFSNGLVPEYLNGEFQALRALLESGIPTVRNRSGGHGAGATPRSIPQHLAAFQLHQTAAAIVLLVEAYKALP